MSTKDDTTNYSSSNPEEERDEIQEVKKMSQVDTNRVRRWRLVVFVVLLSVALSVTLTTYSVLKREEKNDFKTAVSVSLRLLAKVMKIRSYAHLVFDSLQFELFSRTVADAAILHQNDLREAVEGVARDLSIVAEATNQTFPFVTYPDFELRADAARRHGRIEFLSIVNLVTEETYDDYVNFSTENHEQQTAESRYHNPVVNDTFEPIFFTPFISGDGFEPDITRDSYFPIWTVSPPIIDYRLINWNVAFLPDFEEVSKAMLHLKNETVFTGVRPYAEFDKELHKEVSTGFQNRDDFPHSFAWQPVHEVPGDTNSRIVGAVNFAIAWDAEMHNLLPDGVQGIVCVIKNSFNQTYTFEIVGHNATFLGKGDHHEPKYDGMEKRVSLSPFTHSEFPTTEGHCMYEMVSSFEPKDTTVPQPGR